MSGPLPEPPVRLCCGERHYGVQCNDGKVMCCLCFDRFEVWELSVLPSGAPVDVCQPCAVSEEQALRRSTGSSARSPRSRVWSLLVRAFGRGR